MNYSLLNVRPYDFENDNKERVRGCKLSLLSLNEKVPGDGSLGNRVEDVPITWEIYQDLFSQIKKSGKELPCNVNVGLEVRGLQAKPVVTSVKVD